MNKDIYNSYSDNMPHNDAEAVWGSCVEIIKDNVNWRTFQTWFEPIKAVSLQSNILTLQVPSQFFYEWLEEHYVELLGKTIKRILGKEGRLEYRIVMDGGGTQRNPASVNMPGGIRNNPPRDHNYVDMPLKWDDPTNIKTPYAIPGLKRMQVDPQLNS